MFQFGYLLGVGGKLGMGVLLILWPQHYHVKTKEDKQEGLIHIIFSYMYSKGKGHLH